MLKLIVFLLFAVLTHGQKPAPSVRPVPKGEVKKGAGKQAPSPKPADTPKPEVDRNGEERHGSFQNSYGQDTWFVMSCIPGRPGAWRQGQTEKVPCQCLAMVQRVQDDARAECDKNHAPRTKAWRDCHADIPACSELADTGSAEVWGDKFQNRCQVYCYRRRCQCCDDRQAQLRMDRTARLTVAGMVALKSHLRLLPREQACNEFVVLGYAPLRPTDLLYVFARSLVPE